MEEQVFDRKKYTRLNLIGLMVIALLCMITMLYYAKTKVVIVSAEEADARAWEEAVKEEQTGLSKSFRLDYKSNSNAGYFVVPCPQEAELSVSERPDKNRITLSFTGVNTDYFVSNAPFGDFERVSGISEELGKEEAKVIIETELPCYAVVSKSGREVTVSLMPVDKEETVVVIDPFYGGAYTGTIAGDIMEKDINLAIARKVKELSSGKGYRVVLTRDSDETVLEDERLEIIDAVGGDYYVGIALRTNMEDQTDFGASASYNKEYFRNGFENVDFADVIMKAVCESTDNRANSLDPAGPENVILRVLKIPGMELRAGTITNIDEAALLGTQKYIERIAEGIIEGLDGVVK